MYHKTWIDRSIVFVLTLALVFVVGVEVTQRVRAQDGQPPELLEAQASVGMAFTYQGRLTNSSGGSPIAGPCDFRFNLYDDALSPHW